MEIDLTNKRALVTAGASGIGRAIATRFLECGARVCVCDIDSTALDDFARANPKVLAVKADVSQPDEVATAVSRMSGSFGGVEIVVNNAGVSGPTESVDRITIDDWRRTLDVNVTSQFLTAKYAVPIFKSQGGGAIINISSTAGRMGMPLRSPYSTSKYAVRGLTDALAVELGEYNIRVNAILPGMIKGSRGTRVMAEQAAARGVTLDEYMSRALMNVSMRTLIDAEEVADLAAFLGSDLARHISGQSIGVCGNFESYRVVMGN